MAKPPNIIVYCCRNASVFERTCKLLYQYINKEKYLIYQLDESEQWQQYCRLLVLNTSPNDIPRNILSQFKIFTKTGGKLLSLGGYFTSLLPWDSYIEPPGPCLDEIVSNPTDLCCGQGLHKNIVLLKCSDVEQKLSTTLKYLDVSLSENEETQLAPLYCYSKSSEILDSFFQSLARKGLYHETKNAYSLTVEGYSVPIKKDYDASINFPEFPDVFVMSRVVTSTQKLLWESSLLTSSGSSVAIVAEHQRSGIGRGKNQWLSPAGSLSLSFHFTLDDSLLVSKKLQFIQYMAGVAAVNAIRNLAGSAAPVALKWPNDIYSRSGFKIGGILVNCATSGKNINCCVGIGINVCNAEPTVSVVNLTKAQVNIKLLAFEICRKFKEEISNFNKDGVALFVDRYCQIWLHQNARVRVNVGVNDCEAIIVGIDQDGYLLVENVYSKKRFSVQPDGNSFDMMLNLIAVKSVN